MLACYDNLQKIDILHFLKPAFYSILKSLVTLQTWLESFYLSTNECHLICCFEIFFSSK